MVGVERNRKDGLGKLFHPLPVCVCACVRTRARASVRPKTRVFLCFSMCVYVCRRVQVCEFAYVFWDASMCVCVCCCCCCCCLCLCVHACVRRRSVCPCMCFCVFVCLFSCVCVSVRAGEYTCAGLVRASLLPAECHLATRVVRCSEVCVRNVSAVRS